MKKQEKKNLVNSIIYRVAYLLKYDENFLEVLNLIYEDFPNKDLYFCDFSKLDNKQNRKEIVDYLYKMAGIK